MDAVDQQPAAPALRRPWGVAGIDPHKHTFTVAVLDERGGLYGVVSLATSDQGLAAALAWLDAVEFELDRVGVEGSAWLGSQVATFLAAAGYDVREVQASRTAERRRRRRRAKTDAEDAQAIAPETLAHPDMPPAGKQHAADPDWDELLALRNQRRSLTAQRRRLLNEAESVLVGLPLVVRAVLPATSQVRPRLRALARGAADQLELTGADRVHLAWLAASTADIARLDQRIRHLDQRIPAVLARLDCTLTEEVGIAVGAMELLVEVGDPTRFAPEARLLAGAAPRRWRSPPERATVSPSGTGWIWAATAGSTRCCTPCTSPRRAATSHQRLRDGQARRAQDRPRSPPRPQAAARQRRHPAHVGRPPTAKVPHPERLQPDNPEGRLTKEPRVDLLPVRARTRVTKGPGSKAAGLAMAFKLLEAAQDRWRAVNGPHLVALVRAGPRFENGRLVERPKEAPEEEINEVAA